MSTTPTKQEDEISTPELDRMREIQPKSHAIGEFLEWLEHHGIELAKRHRHNKFCRDGLNMIACGYVNGGLEPHRCGSIEKLLAAYFDIDLQKADREKQALLEQIRSHNP